MAAIKLIDWPDCAMRLAGLVPEERLHPAVVTWARRAPPRARWLVAFSGGADSLALLLLLWAHWPERRGRLQAVHFNHRLRGAESNRDERFCATVCRRLEVTLTAERWLDAPAHASEAAARAARHGFFDRQLRRLRAGALWLGHQQDDVAETLLMRLARGSGAGGLAAPRPVQLMPKGRVHLRPLLGLKKREIAAALQQCGGVWCEDRTNTGDTFLRTRMRHEVVPVWQAAVGERDAVAGAALSRELIEEDDTALQAWVTRVAPHCADGSLNLRRLRGMPAAVVRRALHEWLGRNGKGAGLSRQAFNALLEAVLQQRVTRQSLSSGAFAEIGRQRLRLVAATQKTRGRFQRTAN